MTRLRCLMAVLLFSITSPAWAQEPPALDVRLTPRPGADGSVARLEVEMRLPSPQVSAGEALLRMPVTLVSTPTAAYQASDIQVRDSAGPLSLSSEDEPATPEGVYRRYLAERAPVGDLVISYSTAPRVVTTETRNGPLFDLRSQTDGLMGAGVYFFALPLEQAPYRITLNWDLSALPEGARGVWSRGEGERSVTAPASMLAFSYYAVGRVSSEPTLGAEDFALYWLSQPPFDIAELAVETRAIYAYMSRFFDDADAPYRIFIRENPYPAGGGTALAGSFMFGYGATVPTTVQDLQMLLAHEMAHTWPTLTDNAHALTSWYTEGMAEYYSLDLTYRAGLMDPDTFLKVANSRADTYYANPHIRLTNAEAGAIFWSDARAQRVPYGRGFMYLTNVDAQVREASEGRRSLDDLVLEVLARQRRGEPAGLAEWREMVVAELGATAGDEFDLMTRGERITPLPGSLGVCFRPVEIRQRPFDLGFDEMRLAVVANLRSDSAAARAGLANGDEIVSMTRLEDVKADDTQSIDVTIRREGQTYATRFLPRGEAVDGWRWEKIGDDCVPSRQ